MQTSLGQVTKHVERWHVERRTNMSPIHVTLKAGVKLEKLNSGLNGIRTHDFCDTVVVLYQLSYQDNWELASL